MVIVLFALAFALVGGGFYSIYWGLPLIVMERGWTWVIAGSMFASSGFIIFALALIVRALHRLPDYLEAAHPDLQPELEAPSAAPRTMFRPAPPEMPGRAPKAPPVPPLTPITDVVTDGEAELPAEKAPEPALAAPAERAAPAITAPPPRPPLPLEPRPAQPEEKERTSRIGSLFGRSRDVTPAPAAPPAERSAPIAAPEPPPRPQMPPLPVEPRPAQPDDTDRTSRIGSLFGRTRDRAPPPVRPVPPEPAQPAEVRPDVPIRAELPEPPAPETIEEPAEPPAPEAAEEAPPPTVVGTYTAGSTLYVMYSDGSIEAETATGVLRFASLDALKEHVSRGEMG